MKSFNEVYQEVYKDSGEGLKSLKDTYTSQICISLILPTVLIIIALLTRNILFIFLSFFVLLLSIVHLAKHFSRYKYEYKRRVIRSFVKGYIDTLEYYPERGILSRDYRLSGFDVHYDRYRSEDLIEGVILDKCKILMGEVHTERRETSTDSDGHTTTSYVTLFHGLFAKIELNKMTNIYFEVRKNQFLSDVFKGKNKLDMDSRRI